MSTDDTATHIRELEDQRYRAILANDLDTFAGLCHDELIYIHSNGSRDSLQSYLQKVADNHYDYRRIDHPIERVVVIGDVAIVVGSMNADLFIGGAPVHLDNLSLATWVRMDGQWKFLSYQPTPKPHGPSADGMTTIERGELV